MDGTRRDALTDTELNQELEAALGVEPSPEFLARVRTRIEAEPRRAAFARSWDPLFAVGIVGIVLAVVVPQMLRPSPSSTQIVRVSDGPVRVPVPSAETDDAEPSRGPQPQQRRNAQAQPAKAESPAPPGDSQVRAFEDLILLAPSDREAFDRLLKVANDQTIVLVAPVLESTHAAAVVLDAVVNVPALARPEGVSQ